MTKSKNWIDFADIKTKITMEMVIDRYGLAKNLKQSGKNLVGCCPIHNGSNPRQFSVNLQKNIWNCFGNCKTGGNVLDFVAIKEFGDKEPESIRKAGMLMKDWFSLPGTGLPDSDNKAKTAVPDPSAKTGNKLVRKETETQEHQETLVNSPLAFELKSLESEHDFFKQRAIDPETVKYFGLGFCKKGMMKGRIAIPIHDHEGNLIAYCGRAVAPKQIEEEGKYKLPANFAKLLVVYNLHRQTKEIGSLILVESYLSVWRLYQAGFANAVALMGSVLGEAQEELILNLLGATGRILLMFDADEDGHKCRDDCLSRLSPKAFVKAVDFSQFARKPHQLTPEQIKSLI